MARPRHHRRLTTAAHLLRKAVYCVVMLTLWRGPIPWCHIHACEGHTGDGCIPHREQTPESVPTGLAEHLDRYHHGRLMRDLPHGWHWHYVIPGDSDGDGVADHDATDLLSPRTLQSLTTCEGPGGDWHTPIADLLSGTCTSSLLGPPAPSPLTAPGGAVTAFRTGPDVRLLAGVMQC